MKVKEYSKNGKAVIVILAFIASVLKWVGIFKYATIPEIWQVAACAYGILLGTIDFNISRDGFIEKKVPVAEPAKEEEDK